MCYVSYYLILWVYGHGGDVAAVTSVRQASIPFSVLIGGLWLKEPDMTRRLFASLILAPASSSSWWPVSRKRGGP